MTRFLSKFSDSHFRKFALQLFFVCIACLISYFWLDRFLAKLMTRFHTFSGWQANYNLADNITALAYAGVLIVMAFYAYKRLVNHESTRLIATAGGISFAVPIAFFIKTELQYILGRTSVRYNGSDTLVFVKYPKAYGFHFLAGGGSFPSGHMCVFTTCFLMISFYYPRFRPYAIIALFALGFMLIFDNYHFLSDVIAGTYLGFIIAKVTYKLET